MHSAVARTLLIGAMLLAVAGCGYGVSATFNADGTVAVGLKFLLPQSLLASGQGLSVSGFSDADIAKANAEVASKYPGAKVVKITEGDQAGVLLTVPFKTEKDAFAFMTEPTKLSPTGPTSGGGATIDVGNTGGLFVSATHTTSGQTDTYTFKTQVQPPASPSPGSQSSPDLSSIIRVTFSLTVPHEITSAPDALFTQDRKTAIWELSLTQAQTLTATTSSSTTLAGFAANAPSGQSSAILIGVGLVAVALGFLLAKITPWLFVRGPAVVPATAPADLQWPASIPPPAEPAASVMSGPPPEMPPPPNPAT